VRSEEKLLKDFVRFIGAQAITGPIRAQMALDWACTFSPGRGAAGQLNRLKVVRGFLSYLQAAIPETEVPALGLLGNIRRPKPYLYSRQQLERLIEAASLLKPNGSLRSHTYATMIGLIASTGLRVGEAIRLTLSDVHLQTVRTCVTAPFGRPLSASRIWPVFSTVAATPGRAFMGCGTHLR
jgi:integrase